LANLENVIGPRSNESHSRRAKPRALYLVLAIALLSGCSDPPPRPNVLLYVVDTLRADALEPYGNTLVETPTAARLAREGVLFERASAHSSWTRPSVASILTGLAPDMHGVEAREDEMPGELALLSEKFSQAGYATGAIVTNPNVGVWFGFDQGYDTFHELYTHTGKGIVEGDDERAGSDEVTQRAIEWIDQLEGSERPFFLFILTTDPHWPYEPPPEFDPYKIPVPEGRARKKRRRMNSRPSYDGEVAFNDHSLGVLLDHLGARDRLDDTLVVLTSDHGEAFGEHQLRGHGHSLFDEVVRVPLIVRRPREPEPGRRVETPVQLVDLYPTLLDAAGLPIPAGLEGRILPPEPGAAARPIYARLHLDGVSLEMMVEPPWKLIVGETGVLRPQGGLYDLEHDPEELRNIDADEPERAAALEANLRARAAAPDRITRSGADEPPRVLPDEVRDALEALGYLEDGHPKQGIGE
jgi:choline-sulfatase